MDDSNKTDDARWVYIGDGMTQEEYEEAMRCIADEIRRLKQLSHMIYLKWSGDWGYYEKVKERDKNDSTQN